MCPNRRLGTILVGWRAPMPGGLHFNPTRQIGLVVLLWPIQFDAITLTRNLRHRITISS